MYITPFGLQCAPKVQNYSYVLLVFYQCVWPSYSDLIVC